MKIETRMFVSVVAILIMVIGVSLLLQLFLNNHRVVVVHTVEPDSLEFIADIFSTSTVTEAIEITIPIASDIEPQKPLQNPPDILKAIYATSWSAGSTKKMNYLIDLINTTELNALVIDIKDFSGLVTYETKLPQIKEYGAYELRTPNINKLLKRLHDNNIYVIARVSVFQDDLLARARPELALMSSSTQSIWEDRKGLAWVDPAAKSVWEYNVAIAREALERGFDEINFDYMRFASDGDLNDIVYPFWDEVTLKVNVMRDFWEYARKELPTHRISIDLFGLATINLDGLGIGQHLEYAVGNFDYIAPMVYPSHYANGFIGYQKPAQYPYEVVKYSLDVAVSRFLAQQGTTTPVVTKLRPWLQDFDLGADYTPELVRGQIQAVYDATEAHPEFLSGWMLWNPSNVYTKEALEPFYMKAPVTTEL